MTVHNGTRHFLFDHIGPIRKGTLTMKREINAPVGISDHDHGPEREGSAGQRLGSGPINFAVMAFKWRRDRAEMPAVKAGGLCKGSFVRGRSHLNVRSDLTDWPLCHVRKA